MSSDDDKFLQRMKEQLDRELDELDPATARRLQKGRLAALEAAERPHRNPLWMPGLALASVSVLAVALWLAIPQQSSPDVSAFDDLELMADSQELEFYQEAEFYYWLALEESHDAAG